MRGSRYSAEWSTDEARLRVTEPTPSEVRAAARALSADYNEPTNRALMTNDTVMSEGDVVAMFEQMWSDGGRPFLLYRDDALVGDCDLRDIEEGQAEVAIMVGPRDAQGKGLGTRFSVMTLAIAFGPLHLSRVYASVRPENAGSLRMFEKVGYAIDESARARRYAGAPDDVCLSIDRDRLARAHPRALANVIVAVRAAEPSP